jgi:hypothetical protein
VHGTKNEGSGTCADWRAEMSRLGVLEHTIASFGRREVVSQHIGECKLNSPATCGHRSGSIVRRECTLASLVWDLGTVFQH